MINGFEFLLPTRVKFEAGAVNEIANEVKNLNKSKPMIVTDKGLIKAGVVDKVTNILKKEGLGDYVIFDEIEPNPRDTTVQNGYEKAKTNDVDILIAIGGGSSIDAAKAIGVLMSHGGTINEYEDLDKIVNPIPDLIAIPTTVGTGSEVTCWAVITDSKRHYKMSVGGANVFPKLALVDPELVETLPKQIISSTGMDALTHAIEGYTAKVSEPITNACGLYAIKLIAENIRNAVYTDSKDAKANMLMASLLAGMCFGNSDVASVHCMAESLGGHYDTPHGIANAILLPYVMEYSFVADLDKFAEIASAMGVSTANMTKREAALAAVNVVKELNMDLEIPTLKDVGTKEKDIDELAQRSSVNLSTDSNVRAMTKEDYLIIFNKAYNI